MNKIFSEIKSDKFLEDFYNFNLIDKNVIIERLMKIRNKKTLIKVIRNLPDLDVKLKILSSLDKKIVEEYINEYKGEYLEYQILLLTDNANLILDVLSHQTIDVEYEDEMLPLFRVVANKYKGVRAGTIWNETAAKFAKMDDDINVITLGGDYLTTNDAICIVRNWLASEFKGGRYKERLDMIEEIEKENMK